MYENPDLSFQMYAQYVDVLIPFKIKKNHLQGLQFITVGESFSRVDR